MPLHKKQEQWNRDSKTFNPLNKTQWEEGSSFSITIALWKSKFPDKKKPLHSSYGQFPYFTSESVLFIKDNQQLD